MGVGWMLFLGHEFEDHVYPILLSDWSILILTYFYRIFTAKKWNFTTKSDLFRKKTIPIYFYFYHERNSWLRPDGNFDSSRVEIAWN